MMTLVRKVSTKKKLCWKDFACKVNWKNFTNAGLDFYFFTAEKKFCKKNGKIPPFSDKIGNFFSRENFFAFAKKRQFYWRPSVLPPFKFFFILDWNGGMNYFQPFIFISCNFSSTKSVPHLCARLCSVFFTRQNDLKNSCKCSVWRPWLGIVSFTRDSQAKRVSTQRSTLLTTRDP